MYSERETLLLNIFQKLECYFMITCKFLNMDVNAASQKMSFK